jgi:hypothetical protein
MSALAALAVCGALVLLRGEVAPPDALAPLTVPPRVEGPTIELPVPIPRQADPEPLDSTVDQRAALGPSASVAASAPQAVAPGVAALEIAILLPDGRLADSGLWNVSLRAETPPFVGGSNPRRVLMLDASRRGYVVSDLVPGQPTWVEVDDEAGRSLLRTSIPGQPAGQARRVEVRLPEFPTQLELLVTDASGTPLPDAMVAIGPSSVPEWSARWMQTDRLGRLSRCVSALEPKVTVKVRHPGFTPRVLSDVALEPGSMSLVVVLEAGRAVRVFVCDVTGAPLEVDAVGARVGIQGFEAVRASDGDAGPGRWELRDLPEGTVTLYARVFGSTFTEYHDTELEEARFELAECGRLSVSWDPGPEGGIDRQVVVSSRLRSGPFLENSPSERGRRMIALPQGDYEVGLMGAPVAKRHAVVRAGQVTELRLSP